MNARTDQVYSTLEAVPGGHRPYRQEKPLPSDAGKQVVPDYGKQAVVYNGIEVAAKEYYAQDNGGHYLPSRPSRSKRIIFSAALGLVVILAVVLGGIFGSRHKSSTPPSTPSSLPHNVAAVSFASNSVNNTRVYYQDETGQIIEAASSANNATWHNNPIGSSGKNSSALAAAVSRPGFPLVSDVCSTKRTFLTFCRKSVYSILTRIISSTMTYMIPQPTVGDPGRYQDKATRQCRTRVCRPYTTNANFAPIPRSSHSKIATGLCRLGT